MEMSWVALLPTMAAVVVLAVLILTRSGKPKSVTDGAEAAPRATDASTLFPSLVPWVDAAKTLRHTRQHIWPVDKVAFEAQARRGMIVAGVMAIMAFLAALGGDNNDFALIGFIVGVIPIAGVAMAFGALHAIIVRLMPYRGPIVSTAIGALIGFATMLASRYPPAPLDTKLIYVGAIYGLIVGVIEFMAPPAKTTGSRRPTRLATSRRTER